LLRRQRGDDVCVIPVLLGGAAMPSEQELTMSLRAGLGQLCRLDGHVLQAGKQDDWEYQFGRLRVLLAAVPNAPRERYRERSEQLRQFRDIEQALDVRFQDSNQVLASSRTQLQEGVRTEIGFGKVGEHRRSGAERTAQPGHEAQPMHVVDQARLRAVVFPLEINLSEEAIKKLEDVIAQPSTGIEDFILRRYAQTRIATVGDGVKGSLHRVFVNLHLRTEILTGPHRGEKHFGQLDDLLLALPTKPVWILLGAPGGGKSTLLMNLELRRAHAALTLDDYQCSSTRRDLCVRVSLANYDCMRHGGMDIEQWIDQQLAGEVGRECSDPPTLSRLSQRYKVRLLFDGLNEIRAPGAEEKWAAQAEIVKWAARYGSSGHPAPIFTVRSAEFIRVPTGLDGEPWPAEVDVLPWRDEEMEAYCKLRFPGKGNPVWGSVLDRPAAERVELLDLLRNPFNLKLQCDLFDHDRGELAKNRTDLLGRVGLLRLATAVLDRKGNAASLDLVTESDVKLLGKSERSPIRPLHALQFRGSFLRTLARLAFRLHEAYGPTNWTSFVIDDSALAAVAGEAQLDALAQLALSSFFLRREPTGELRFSHQLWQEYFAGWQLANLPMLDWPNLVPPKLPRRGSDADPILDPSPNDWEETVQLAGPMIPSHLTTSSLGTIALTNLGLAARAAAACGLSSLRAMNLTDLKVQLLNRVAHSETPLALRIEAGMLLGALDDDIRYIDAGGCLGTRFRVPREQTVYGGVGWIALPEERRALRFADAQCSIQVIPGTQVAFAPVTNAEFKFFVEGFGYWTNDGREPGWWFGNLAQRWLRGEIQNLVKYKYWFGVFSDWRRGGKLDEAGFREIRFPDASDGQFDKNWRPLLDGSEDAFRVWLVREHGAKPARWPELWRNPTFNAPLLPVVGVSFFEAQAYCAWLTAQSAEWDYHLPTEAEWVLGAQSGAQLLWPWGGDESQLTERMNYHATGVRRQSPVGVFPAGRSLLGLEDIAGQVAEWCNSEYVDEIVDACICSTPMTDLAEDTRVVVRGGSWQGLVAAHCNTEWRGGVECADRSFARGFRLMRRPRSPAPPLGLLSPTSN
jgi:formylglycine-generating enzyme required for sulfatase activity